METVVYKEPGEGFYVVQNSEGMLYMYRETIQLGHAGSETFKQLYRGDYNYWFEALRREQLAQAAADRRQSNLLVRRAQLYEERYK